MMLKLPPLPISASSRESPNSTHDEGYISASPRMTLSASSPRVHLIGLETRVHLHDAQLKKIDVVSAQTAQVLQHLNQDISSVKESTETTLEALKQTLVESNSEHYAQLEEELTRVADVAQTATTDIASLSLQVQALKLGLECVESSMEDLDVKEDVDTLRSRLNDIDLNLETSAKAEEARTTDINLKLEALKADIEESKNSVVSMQALVESYKQEMEAANAAAAAEQQSQTPAMTPISVLSPTPSMDSPSNAGFERLRTALATLSSSHNSLLQALTLVHKSQHELSVRVGDVGRKAAAKWEPTARSARKISYDVNSRVSTFPISNLKDEKDGSGNIKAYKPTPLATTKDIACELTQMKAIVATQARELSSQSRTIEDMQEEIGFLRSLLVGLIKPGTAAVDTSVNTEQRASTSTSSAGTQTQRGNKDEVLGEIGNIVTERVTQLEQKMATVA